MAASENLPVSSGSEGSAPEQMAQLLAYEPATRQLMKAYAGCMVFPEGHLLAALHYDLYTRIIPLADAFMRDFPTTDPTYKTRAEGLEKMQLGVKEMLLGEALIIVDHGDPKYFAPAVEQVGTAISRLRKVLPPEITAPGIDLIRNAASNQTDPRLRQPLRDLVELIDR